MMNGNEVILFKLNKYTDLVEVFGIDSVPVIFRGTIEEGIKYVQQKPMSTIRKSLMEGLVGRPLVALRDRSGNRVIVKLKVKDFENI